ncbi:SidA/IucD/PvdA family monooxygenase [Yersinia pseudotuberculosis]|nr:SidA/IucD/PvdA family monooxygenase [Yersinia pseudotuberculosis]CND48112.1 putative siderophore biosynthesis protein IucD [Yersinia pseudotuberculosis]
MSVSIDNEAFNKNLYDVIGIGFGPANIALAIAMEEAQFRGRCLFLERNTKTEWQPEMLLSGSDIQNNPCRDLVTPRNPRSRYTFTNFLFENNRLFEHLNLGLEFPLRREFAEYVQWVASFFSHQTAYGRSVKKLTLVNHNNEKYYRIETDKNEVYFSRSVVVAPGRTPMIPTVFEKAHPHRVFHLTRYLKTLNQLNEKKPLNRIAVVGGSQSAVEIILHLRQNYPNAEIINIQRGYGFRLKDTK